MIVRFIVAIVVVFTQNFFLHSVLSVVFLYIRLTRSAVIKSREMLWIVDVSAVSAKLTEVFEFTCRIVALLSKLAMR